MKNYDDKHGLNNIENWIRKGINQDAVEFAEWFGRELAYDKFSNSQIRNIFGEVKRQQMAGYNETKFLMLKPKLAYSAKRQTGRYAEKAALRLKDLLTKGIEEVINSEDPGKGFTIFADFFEAILAYHRAYEGARRPRQDYQQKRRY